MTIARSSLTGMPSTSRFRPSPSCVSPASYRAELRRPSDSTVTSAEKPCSPRAARGRRGRRRRTDEHPPIRPAGCHEVVHDDRDLGAINRLEEHRSVRGLRHCPRSISRRRGRSRCRPVSRAYRRMARREDDSVFLLPQPGGFPPATRSRRTTGRCPARPRRHRARRVLSESLG
jgi:hypothetical protein